MKTGVFIGRFQPWHEGHQACIEAILKTHDRAVLLIRTGEKNEKNPFGFTEVCGFIRGAMGPLIEAGTITLIELPDPGFDLTVFHGRAVGYGIEELKMPPAIEAVSATQKRKEMSLGGGVK